MRKTSKELCLFFSGAKSMYYDAECTSKTEMKWKRSGQVEETEKKGKKKAPANFTITLPNKTNTE